MVAIAGALVAVLVVAGGLAVGRRGHARAPSTRSSRSPARSIPPAARRERLAEVGNNGRLDHWKVALEGDGAVPPARHRRRHLREPLGARTGPRPSTCRTRHSLYLEVLGELGIVGLRSSSRSCSRSSAARCHRVRGVDRAIAGAVVADRPHVGAAGRARLGLGDAGRHGLGAHHRRRAARAARGGRPARGGSPTKLARLLGARRAQSCSSRPPSSRSRRRACRRASATSARATARRARQGAGLELRALGAAGAVPRHRLLRRAHRPAEARRPGDAGRDRARPRQLDLPLRPRADEGRRRASTRGPTSASRTR